MGIVYNINYLLKMRHSKQAINGAKELVDAGILEEDTLDILKKYDENIKKVSKEVTEFVKTTKTGNKEERRLKREIKKTKRQMKDLRKQAKRDFKNKHHYLGSIFGFPIGTILNFPILGRVFHRIGMQFNSEYQELKATLKSLRDEKMENDLSIYEAGENVREAQRKLEEYRNDRSDFYDSILNTYNEYKERIPNLRTINLNLNSLKILEENGKIPAEFVTRVKDIYEQIKNGEEVKTNGWKLSDFVEDIRKLGIYQRFGASIQEDLDKLVQPYLNNGNNGNDEIVKDGNSEQKGQNIEKGVSPVTEPETKQPLLLEDKSINGQGKGEEESKQGIKGRNWKGDSLEAPFSNSSLNREILVRMGISDPENEMKALGKDSIKDGIAILEQAIKDVRQGNLSIIKNPTILEMANDYCRVEEEMKKQEQEAGDKRGFGIEQV